MKTVRIILMITTFFLSVISQAVSFDCQVLDANGKTNDYLKLAYDLSGQIQNLSVNGYSIVENGKQKEDRDIGQDVFDVEIGGLKALSSNGKILNVSLHDYSDMVTYAITLSEESGEAAIVSTYVSSDGDGRLHVTGIPLTCKK
jgi:hypothetical protein